MEQIQYGQVAQIWRLSCNQNNWSDRMFSSYWSIPVCQIFTISALIQLISNIICWWKGDSEQNPHSSGYIVVAGFNLVYAAWQHDNNWCFQHPEIKACHFNMKGNLQARSSKAQMGYKMHMIMNCLQMQSKHMHSLLLLCMDAQGLTLLQRHAQQRSCGVPASGQSSLGCERWVYPAPGWPWFHQHRDL